MRVRCHKARYRREHVSKTVQARRGRRTFAYRKRMAAFGQFFASLKGRELTKEALLGAFVSVYNRGYSAGWVAGKMKRERALEGQQAAQNRSRSQAA